MNKVIKCQGLSRTYSSYKKPEGFVNSIKGFLKREHIERQALRPLNLEIDQGQVVGLVGANGAGKTTLLKLLSGLIHPSAGSVEILGYTPSERKSDFLRRISILLGQKNQLWWDIPPADSFHLLMAIYDLDEKVAKKRYRELAQILDCGALLEIQLRRLSLGERMKMEIIGSLLHAPEILFLDEPTIGLDVMAQNTIRKFLEEYVKTSKPTIILTSHYMDDIARLSDRLLLMSQGSIVYDGTVPEFIKSAETKQKLICTIENAPTVDTLIVGDKVLKAGERLFSAELKSSKVGEALAAMMKISPVSEVKIEETDFEDVIHQFLEKESGRSKAINSVTPRI